MVNAGKLLNDLKTILRRLTDDIRDRCDQGECINKYLQKEYNGAKKADRTAQTYLAWRDEVITQTARPPGYWPVFLCDLWKITG